MGSKVARGGDEATALHEIVQSNQIADRGNVTYARLRFASRTMYNHVYTCMDSGRSRSTVVVVLIVAAGVYQGCCYVFGYYYAKDRATRSHQTVHPRHRDVFVSLPMGYGKSVCYFPLPLVFDRLRRVEKKSVVVVVSPLVALMKDQVSDCFHESRGVVYRTKMARTTQRGDL